MSAVFHADARRDDVTRYGAFAANVKPVIADHITVYLAHDDNLAGIDVGRDGAVAADGNTVFRNVDSAFDAAVDIKRFRAADFPLDDEGTANAGLLQRGIGALHG